LGTVPDEEWEALASRGFDLLWLMGVWRRSPGARQAALAHPGLRRAYAEALPDWRDEDVVGSPYAIHGYSIDPALGESRDLARVKSRLNNLGIGLIVDFVPNHLALDHPWVDTHPDRFVRGSEQDVRAHPDWFFSPHPSIYVAHGKDPNFPPWTDTAQVNFFSRDMREALIDELVRISSVADGVRCDMAMLALHDVFRNVWGWLLRDAPAPSEGFWTEAVSRVRSKRPDFLFLAEAYWGLESRLIDLGFDFAYDKTLYDLLRSSAMPSIRQHLQAAGGGNDRAVRFIENHDEARAVAAFGPDRVRAAAVVFATLPGTRLFHDGQLEGRRIRLPVQLDREPSEPTDAGTARFHDRLLRGCTAAAFHDGAWALLETGAVSHGNESHQNLLAWSWRGAEQLGVVVVNYSAASAQGWLKTAVPDTGDEQVRLRDELTGEVHILNRHELSRHGIYVDLGPWGSHIFTTVVPA
jgi:hypothetical protein